MVSLLQNLTATFLCHKCTCWWENNGQDLSGEDIAENLLSMSAVHTENYLLTRLNPHLYIFMTAMSHFPSLFMTRPPKSWEILRMSHQPNSLYTSAQIFHKILKFLIQNQFNMRTNRVYSNITGSSMKSSDYWNNALYCTNNPFKLLQHYFVWKTKSGKAYKYEVTNPI